MSASYVERSRRRCWLVLAASSLLVSLLSHKGASFLSGRAGASNGNAGEDNVAARRTVVNAASLTALLQAVGTDPAVAVYRDIYNYVEPEAEWLARKAKEEGVVTLPSGLMYKVLEEGPKKGSRPDINQPCNVSYVARFTNDTVFEAAEVERRPEECMLGWREAMMEMRQGDTWEIYVPSRLAYGLKGLVGPYYIGEVIPPGASLVYVLRMNLVPENPYRNPAAPKVWSWPLR